MFAVDLITTDKYAPNFSANTCLGAYVFDRATHDIFIIRARQTYLCTGGHGKVYLYTSNPDSASGDGLAMGWRAGCKVANLEFMQFHPTCLFVPAAKNFLISEAVRGEGAIIKNKDGRDFVSGHDPRGSLAPRDIVARAIDIELKRRGDDCVFLDMRPIGSDKIKGHFPNIFATCMKYGIDPCRDLVPVVPAAHYSCGGLVVDQNARTTVHNLYALGEVACTGLHGANRLASNSLLEALVFARRAADDAQLDETYKDRGTSVGGRLSEDVRIPAWNAGRAAKADELVLISHAWDEIRRLMWHYVGIVRSEERLKRALNRITALRSEIDSYYWDYEMTSALMELRNLSQVAWLTIRCAVSRKESRGIHYNIDYPEAASFGAKDTIIW